jgi:hypothetical protein
MRFSIKLLILFIILYHYNLRAQVFEATIVTKIAPIFLNPDVKSPVLNYLNRGSKIIILNSRDTRVEENEFYLTQTKIGTQAYVHKSHVFILSEDSQELASWQEINFNENSDETNFRLNTPEPLQESYPFYPAKKNLTQIALLAGPHLHSSLGVKDSLIDQARPWSQGLLLSWGTNPSWDKYKNVIAGVEFQLQQYTIESLYKNYSQTEQKINLSLGPSLEWYLPKANLKTRWRFSLQSSLQLSFYNAVNGTIIERNNNNNTVNYRQQSFDFHQTFSLRLIRENWLVGLSLLLQFPREFALDSQKNSITDEKMRRDLMITPSIMLGHIF